jgi:hypothetical protein
LMKLGACSCYHFSLVSGVVWISRKVYWMELATSIKFSVGRLKSSCRPFNSDILALTCMKSSSFRFENLSLRW